MANRWQRFLKQHGGKGHSRAKLKKMYRAKYNSPSWYNSRAGHKRAAKKGWRKRRSYRRNPGLGGIVPRHVSQVTHGATFMEIAVAGIGVVAALTVPQLLKWHTGWKYIAAGVLTSVVGGWVIGSANKTAGKVFFIASLGTTLVMAARMFLWKKSATGLFGQDDWEEDLFGEDEELFGEDEELFGDEEIYGVSGGEDIIRPTAAIEEFVE